MSRIGRVSNGAVAGFALLLGIVSTGQALAQQPVFRNRVLLEDGSAFNAGAQDIRFEGASSKREMGSAMVFGDFNGDGLQDFAVGERKNNRVYIFFGRPVLDPNSANSSDPNGAFIVRPVLSATNAAPDVTITCGNCQLDPNNNSDFGFSLAAGNLNKDLNAGKPLDDLVIGAPFDDAGGATGADRGRAFIVEGRSTWLPSVDADTDAKTHKITASSGNNTKKYYLGFAVAVGDFDNDGFPDLAVSSRGANFPLYAASGLTTKVEGAVHLINGSASIPAAIDVASAAGVRHLAGDATNDFFGESLAFCKIDGSPGADLLVGAIGVDNATIPPIQPNAGAMYVYKGTTLAGLTTGTAAATRAKNSADSEVMGADKDDSLGFTVACGDINGDGFDDAMASAFFAAGLKNRKPGVGEVFAFYGPNLPTLINLRKDGDPNVPASVDGIPDDAQLWIIGSTQGDQFGFSLAAGNVNCDLNAGKPLADIIVGARRYDPSDAISAAKVNAGMLYAIRGSATRPAKFVIDLEAGTTINPAQPGHRIGNYPTASSEDPAANAACDPNSPDDPNDPCAVVSIMPGDVAHAQIGFTTATGDFNGDGCAEVAVGAVGDLTRIPTYSGRAFVVSLKDNDEDGVSDLSDEDNDNDCLADSVEDKNGNGVVDPNETDRFLTDTDGDGLQDGTELGVKLSAPPSLRGERFASLNPAFDCSTIDPKAPQCCLDRDNGLTKTNPLVADTDGDTILDGDEDSDHNGAIKGDANFNGMIDAGEIIGERDPNRKDTDGDGLDDNLENLGGCPNPLDADSDDDGLPDGCIPTANGASDCNDMRAGEDRNRNGAKDANETDPCKADTDGDGLQDGTEVGVPGGGGVPGPNGVFDPNGNPDGTNASIFRPDLDPASKTDPLLIDSDNDCLPDGCIPGFNGGGGCPALDPNVVLNPNAPVLQGEDMNLNGRVDGTILKGPGASLGSPAAGTETDPFDHDSDSDGLDDGLEWGVSMGVCANKDLDPNTFTDPRDADTDNGSVADGLEDINANGRVDFSQANFICGAMQSLDMNNETDPANRLDDRGTDFARTPAPNFTDPNNVTVTAYLQNKTLVVLLDDMDENKDPNVSEQIILNAGNLVDPNNTFLRQGIACLPDDPNSMTNQDFEDITLTETGPNTHLFRGTIPMSVAPGANQNGTLNCIEDDRVRFAYRDKDDLCDQRSVLADVTLTQIRSVNPAQAAPPITTSLTSVSALFKEDLACASVTTADMTVTGTIGPASGAISCVADPSRPQFGSRQVTLTFGAPLPDDLYTFTLDCDAPPPFIADMSGFAADCETSCMLPPGNNPATYCMGVLSGNGTAGGTFVSNFVVDNDSSPSVASTDPNNAQLITPARPNLDRVAATFSEAMDPNTIGAASFTVVGTMMSLTPSSVPYNAATKTATFINNAGALVDDRYTVTLKGTGGSPMRDFGANALDGDGNTVAGGDFVSTFVIDYDQLPSITGVLSPSLVLASSDPNVNIIVAFDQEMEASTVTNPASWSVVGTMGVPIAGTITFDPVTKTATFDPTIPLPDDRYTVTLNGPTDQAGNALDGEFSGTFPTGNGTVGGAFVFSFVVDFDSSPSVTATNPAASGTVTTLRSSFTVTFSEAMLASSVNPSALQIRDNVDPNIVLNTNPGSVVYDALTKTATITTDFALGNGDYQIFADGTSLAGIRDQNQNLLDGDGDTFAGGDFAAPFTVNIPGLFLRALSAQPNLNEVVGDPNVPNDQVRVRLSERPDTASVDPNSYLLTNSAADVQCGTFAFADQGSGSSKCQNCNLLCNVSPTVLPDDKYIVTLKSDPNNASLRIKAKANGSTDFLDGECAGGVCDNPATDFPTGDGAAGGDFVYTFFVDADTTPAVNGIVPLSGSTVGSAGTTVAVTFDQRMDPNTFSTTTFKLVRNTGGGGAIAATYGFDPNADIETLTPGAPLGDDTYTVTLVGDPNGVGDPNVPSVRDFSFPAGNVLNGDPNTTGPADFVATFRVEADATPTVTAINPANGSTSGGTPTTVVATFSEPMDAATITTSSFLVSTILGTVSCGSVAYDPNARQATCTLAGVLANPDDLYSIVIKATVTDLAGNALDGDNNGVGGDDFAASFLVDTDTSPTVISTNPLNGQIRLSAPTAVTATFSEPMNPATITPSSFMVATTMGTVSCMTVTYDAPTKTATCTLQGLAVNPDDLYTIALLGNGGSPIRDLHGNALDGDNNNFAGGNFLATYVVDTDMAPAITATNPPDDPTFATPLSSAPTSVTATFSEAMDPNSVTISSLTVVSNTTGIAVNPDPNGVTYNPVTKVIAFAKAAGIADDEYTATVAGTVNDFAGHAVNGGSDFTFQFQIEAAAPTVKAVDPNNLQVKTTAPTQVVATFSEPMDPNTIKTASFTVTTTMGGVSCTAVAYDPNTEKATCTLSALATPPDDKYSVTLKGTGGTIIRDLAGKALGGGADFTSTYVVDTVMTPRVTVVNPADDPNGTSPLGSAPTAVTVTFSEAMNGATISSSTFLIDGTVPVTPDSVTYDPVTKRATFALATGFQSDLYTVTLLGTGGSPIRDFGGNALRGDPNSAAAADFVSSFTVSTGAPVVTSVADPNGFTLVTDSTFNKIVATFDSSMKSGGGNGVTAANFTVSTSLGARACTMSNNASKTKFTCTLSGLPAVKDDIYTVTLSGVIESSAGAFLNNGVDVVRMITVDTDSSPNVTSTDPNNLQVKVTAPASVTAVFKEPMDPTTITTSTFQVATTMGGVSCTSVLYTVATKTATCNLSALATPPDDNYTITLVGTGGSPIRDLAGNALDGDNNGAAGGDFTSSYVVDTVLPTLAASDPNNLEVRTSQVNSVTATFNEAMNPATISTSSFLVSTTAGTVSCGSVAYSAATKTATCTLSGILVNPDDRYTVTLKGTGGSAIKDFNNHPLNAGTDQVRSFIVDTSTTPTMTATDPNDLDVRSTAPATVTATFSEAMNGATIDPNSFKVTTTQGGVSCSSVTYAASTRTATCNLTGLSTPPDDLFTVALSAAIKDLNNNALTPSVTTFVVDTDPIPAITSMAPAPGSSTAGVTKIDVVFDQSMDASTIVSPATTFTVLDKNSMSVPGTVTYNAATRKATFTPTTSPLPSAKSPYSVTLDGGASGIKDQAGNQLDGEFSGTFPSGDGTAGGDFTATFDSTANQKLTPTSPAETGTQKRGHTVKKQTGKGKGLNVSGDKAAGSTQ